MKSWKDKLLSSGVPLEFTAAKILVNQGYEVAFDYTYKRKDGGEEKDFSVDLSAKAFYPFSENQPIHFTLDLLVECKYRNPSVKWLFLPDINTESTHDFFSPVKIIDEFSNVSIEGRGHFAQSPITCLKGIEVNLQNGEVHDQGILHGSYQLLYAMPHLLQSIISFRLHGLKDELFPFILCPVLVTTAPLYVATYDFEIRSIQETSSFEQLSDPVDFLELDVSIPPSFLYHCQNVFTGLREGKQFSQNLAYLHQIRAMTEERFAANLFPSNPAYMLHALTNGLESQLFKKIFVCTLEAFPILLGHIKKHISIQDASKKTLL